MNKKYQVTFTEGKNVRNPNTRAIMVDAINEMVAGNVIISEFGSLNKKGIPSDRIKITEIREVINE